MTSDWNHSGQYHQVVEANRQYYAKTALMYDATETCVVNERDQRMLELDIDRLIAISGKPVGELRVLDACGGSGNVSLKFLSRGARVTLCDISPELISIFEERCIKQGVSPTIVQSEIGMFLSSGETLFDVIVFSSALHHLENIDAVLALAFSRLSDNGLLFTIFDPTCRDRLKKISRVVLLLDYIAFKLHKQSRDLPAAIMRRVRRTFTNSGTSNTNGKFEISDATLGVLAEYHVEQGIDDLSLVERFKRIGFEVVWHTRYYGARYTSARFFLSLLNDPTAFKLLLRRNRSVNAP